MVPITASLRRYRFWLIERALLPMAIPIFRLVAWTWRARGPEEAPLHEMMQAPRVVLVTFHGMLLQLLRFSAIPAAHGRHMTALLSPSLDGRLLATMLTHFGIDCVYGTSGSRGIGGAIEFIRRVQAGDIGVIAVDGPRGPCCVVKPGFLQIAAAAGAHLALTTTAADRGIRFGSWDRAHLPAPFARVDVSLQMLPPPSVITEGRALATVQEALVRSARSMHSPVLPPAFQEFPVEPEERQP